MSPLLSIPESFGFFIWGHQKDLVYRDSPATIGERQVLIRDPTQAVCERIIENLKKRMNLCLQRGSRHLEQMLFKKKKEFDVSVFADSIMHFFSYLLLISL